MLKFLFKISLVVLILFGLGNYANYLITGKAPDISINKPTLPSINISKLTDSLSDKFKSNNEEEQNAVKNTYLYKWRDAKGVIHYTSEKPSGEIENLESIKLSNKTNIVPAVSESEAIHENATQQLPKSTSTDFPSNIYSPEGVKDLIDQAKDVQNLMNEQFTQQENSINGN